MLLSLLVTAALAAFVQGGRLDIKHNETIVDLKPQIVGGSDALPGDIPWQVSIQTVNAEGIWNHVCGGTILLEEGTPIVGTTAQCCYAHLRVPLADIRVVAGTTNLAVYDEGWQLATVELIGVHPFYNYLTLDNDNGFLLLNGPGLQLTPFVEPIPICDQEPPAGSRCRVSGWGSTQDNVLPARLQKFNTSIVEKAFCRTVWAPTQILPSMICAGGVIGEQACDSDSGGPLTCESANDGECLVGFVSFGPIPCGASALPAVYANLAIPGKQILSAKKYVRMTLE